jgi:hypothetical protein
MRFIIYAKLPDRVDLLPLDIVDDRPSRNVLEEILVLAKILPFKSSAEKKYAMKKSSVELDLDLDLAGNKIKNGDVLEIVVVSERTIPSASRLSFEKVFQQENGPEIIEALKKVASPSLKVERSNIPGKKIDFD